MRRDEAPADLGAHLGAGRVGADGLDDQAGELEEVLLQLVGGHRHVARALDLLGPAGGERVERVAVRGRGPRRPGLSHDDPRRRGR